MTLYKYYTMGRPPGLGARGYSEQWAQVCEVLR